MTAISSQFPPACKEAISDHRLIKPVIRLAKKIQTFVADIFYTFCYFAFPTMRSRPYEIWGRYKQICSDGYAEFPKANNTYYTILSGNQSFERREGKFLNGDELEHWFDNSVTKANRARPFKITQNFYQRNIPRFGEKTNTKVGKLHFQSRGKTPKVWTS